MSFYDINNCYLAAGLLIQFCFSVGENLMDVVSRIHIVNSGCIMTYSHNASTCFEMDTKTVAQQGTFPKSDDVLLFTGIIVYVPQIVLSIFTGLWSDRFGRKLPMTLPCVGMIISSVCLFVSTYIDIGREPLIYVAVAAASIFGRLTVFSVGFNSFISDITRQDQRSRAFTLASSSDFFGRVSGTLMGILILESYGIKYSFVLVGVSLAIVVVIVQCCIRNMKLTHENLNTQIAKDSLHIAEESQNIRSDKPQTSTGGSQQTSKHSSPSDITLQQGEKCSQLKVELIRSFCAKISKSFKGIDSDTRSLIGILLTMLLLYNAARTGEHIVLIKFIALDHIGLPTSWYGYIMAIVHGVSGFFALVVAAISLTICGLADTSIMLTSCVLAIISCFVMAFGRNAIIFCTFLFVGCAASMLSPLTRAILSRNVGQEKQGLLFGVAGLISATSNFIGYQIFLVIYDYTADSDPGIVFAVSGGLYVLIMLFVIRVRTLTNNSCCFSCITHNHVKNPTTVSTISSHETFANIKTP